MSIHTILFDLDGTIIDSALGVTNGVNYALEKTGRKTYPMEELKGFMGPPLVDEFQRFCHISREESAEIVEIFREYYNQKGILENKVYEGMEATFQRLLDAGFRLMVATSKVEYAAKSIAERLGFAKYFSCIAGGLADNTRTGKAEVIEYIIEAFDITDRREILMVGDRHYDIDGARKSHIHSLGVLYGYGSEEELLDAGAERIVSSPEEIATVIIEHAANWI